MAEALNPLYNLMKKQILAYGNIFVDETPVDESAPGKGKTDQGYVVTVVGGLSLNPENRFYLYFPDRKHSNSNQLLAEYKGVLHSDKYQAYQNIAYKKTLFGVLVSVISGVNLLKLKEQIQNSELLD